MDEKRLIRLLAFHAQTTGPHQPATLAEAAWEAEQVAKSFTKFVNGELEAVKPTDD